MLTNVQVVNAKPRDRDYSVADERGLRLLVRANGSKLWQLRYRLEGKARIDTRSAPTRMCHWPKPVRSAMLHAN